MSDLQCPECGSGDAYYAGKTRADGLHELNFNTTHRMSLPEEVLEWECETCGEPFVTTEELEAVTQ